jgi:simple sugar transport system substrate-binding protein
MIDSRGSVNVKKMSRRQFLSVMGKWGILGAGLGLSGVSWISCEKKQNIDSVLNDVVNDGEKGFIYFANKSLGYYFFIIQQEAINRAAQSRGWDFQTTIADFEPMKQVSQANNSLKKRPMAIIVDPVDSEGLISSIELAQKEGIPVGIIDTPVTRGKTAITVAFDNYRGGLMVAEKIISLLQQKYGQPKGLVLNLYGDLKSHAWVLRKKGFESVIEKYKNIQLMSHPTDGDLTKMHDVTFNMLTEFPDLDAIHAPSEAPARGIYQALKEKNKLHPIGSPEHIIFVTIDGEPIAHKWIKEGILDATISQDAIAYGEICVELLHKYSLKGLDVPLGEYSNSKYYWQKAKIIDSSSGPSLMLPPFEVNSSNVKDKRLWGNIAFNDWGIKYL